VFIGFDQSSTTAIALLRAKAAVMRSIVSGNECLVKRMNMVMISKLPAATVFLMNSPSARKPSGVAKFRIK